MERPTEAEKERKMGTCQRTASALMVWRRGTETEGGMAVMTCLSWIRVCSWTAPEPSSVSKP